MQRRLGSVRANMIAFLKENFADVLGDDVKFLDEENGLDIIQKKYCGPLHFRAKLPR